MKWKEKVSGAYSEGTTAIAKLPDKKKMHNAGKAVTNRGSPKKKPVCSVKLLIIYPINIASLSVLV